MSPVCFLAPLLAPGEVEPCALSPEPWGLGWGWAGLPRSPEASGHCWGKESGSDSQASRQIVLLIKATMGEWGRGESSGGQPGRIGSPSVAHTQPKWSWDCC